MSNSLNIRGLYNTMPKNNLFHKIDSEEFEPRIKILLRIMKLIRENNSIGRTTLAMEANLNYTILSKYLDWLKRKSVIELILVDDKIKITMTEKGRKFAIGLYEFSLYYANLIDMISD